MRIYAWKVTWHNECYDKKHSVNVIAPDLKTAITEGLKWQVKSENSDLNPDDCVMVSIVRQMEIG